jgi:uncharacterized repeat protein (TIGR01451 family)
VWLPKEELNGLPSGGTWKANLAMALQDANGVKLAGFDSIITLNVGDKTKMALTPPTLELLAGSHRDKDQSGGYSAGDELIYRVSYTAARDLASVQLDYEIPAGFESAGAHGFAANSGIKKSNDTLSAAGSKQLLKDGIAMKKGETLIIDVPLRVLPGSAVRVASQALATPAGYDAMSSDETVLNLQRKFGVAQALALKLEMAGQTDPDKDAVVAQKTPFTYRLAVSSITKQKIEQLSLRYRLPGGLYLVEAPKIVGTATQATLNTQWNGDADDELFAPDSVFPPSNNIEIEMQVAVKETVNDGVFVQSTISAGAGNLSDAIQAAHRVKVREQRADGDRVRIVKSADADAIVQPGTDIKYSIRVSNQSPKTVRNLLIRDRAPDHTTLAAASCGALSPDVCKTVTLNDNNVIDGQMTHAAVCTGSGRQSDPDGQHVFWCLNGDLEPLADYTVDYTVQVNGAAPQP